PRRNRPAIAPCRWPVNPQGAINFLPPAVALHVCVFRNSLSPIIIEVESLPAPASITPLGSLNAALLISTFSSNRFFSALNLILTFSRTSGSPRERSLLSLNSHFGPRLVLQPSGPGGILKHPISV